MLNLRIQAALHQVAREPAAVSSEQPESSTAQAVPQQAADTIDHAALHRENHERLVKLRLWRNDRAIEQWLPTRMLPGCETILPQGVSSFSRGLVSPWQMYNDLTRDASVIGERELSPAMHAWRKTQRALQLRDFNPPSNLTDRQKAAILASRRDLNWSRNAAGNFPPPLFLLKSLRHVRSLSLAGHGHRFLPKIQSSTITALDVSGNKVGRLQNLPGQLKIIEARNNHIRRIGALPSKLEALDVTGNRLQRITTLPGSLKALAADSNQLKSFEGIPDGLALLSIRHNSLKTLPPPPPGLQALDASFNRLTELPALPHGLLHADVSKNALRRLAPLPPGLEALNASQNYLTELPTLSPGMLTLDVSSNALTALPALPLSLRELHVNGNAGLTALPKLPEALEKLSAMRCALNELPAELPPNLRQIIISSSPVTRVPESFEHCNNLTELRANTCALTTIGRVPQSLRRLDLDYNNFTTVPDALFEAPSHCEILLRNNPLSEEEVERVKQVCGERRAAGLSVPQFVLPIFNGHQDLYNLGGINSTNVHEGRLVGVFRNQINELRRLYPAELDTSRRPLNRAQKREFRAILLDEFKAVKSDARVATYALRGLDFVLNENETKYATEDFSVTPLHILRTVHRFINDLAPAQRTEGLERLQFHLAAGNGLHDGSFQYCSTRFAEEMLTSIAGFDRAPKGVTWEAARDELLAAGKPILQEACRMADEGGESQIKATFQARFRAQMPEKFPNISMDQRERFLSEYVMPFWQTYKDLAQE